MSNRPDRGRGLWNPTPNCDSRFSARRPTNGIRWSVDGAGMDGTAEDRRLWYHSGTQQRSGRRFERKKGTRVQTSVRCKKKNSISVYINDLEGTSGDRTPIYILQMGLYPTERNATAGSDMLTLTSDDGLRLARCQARRGMNSVRQPTSHAISARNS
jgi:hypothetical protein